jgi:hypothetical protein
MSPLSNYHLPYAPLSSTSNRIRGIQDIIEVESQQSNFHLFQGDNRVRGWLDDIAYKLRQPDPYHRCISNASFLDIVLLLSSSISQLTTCKSMRHATFIRQVVHNWPGRDLIFLGNDQTTNLHLEIPAEC